MRIKLDKADIMFSKYIRSRDNWTCQRCHTKYQEGDPGLHCSHYFGRSSESTRFDSENCDALCFGCHQYWGERDREEYRDFKIKQLGEKRFKLLRLRSNQYKKKDRKMSYIIAKKLLEQFLKSSNVQ